MNWLKIWSEEQSRRRERIEKVLRRSVRSCSQTIPEKVRNSRPIKMDLRVGDDCHDGPE